MLYLLAQALDPGKTAGDNTIKKKSLEPRVNILKNIFGQPRICQTVSSSTSERSQFSPEGRLSTRIFAEW